MSVSALLHQNRIINELVQHSRSQVRDHLYNMLAKGLGGWVQKMTIFANVQYCIYADIVGGFEKVQKCADVI